MGTRHLEGNGDRTLDGLWVDDLGNGWDYSGDWLLVRPAVDERTGKPFTQADAESELDAFDLAERDRWLDSEPAELFERVPVLLSVSCPAMRRAA